MARYARTPVDGPAGARHCRRHKENQTEKTMILPAVGIAMLLQVSPVLDRTLVLGAVQPVFEAQKIPGAVVAIARNDSIVLVEGFGVRDLANRTPMGCVLP